MPAFCVSIFPDTTCCQAFFEGPAGRFKNNGKNGRKFKINMSELMDQPRGVKAGDIRSGVEK